MSPLIFSLLLAVGVGIVVGGIFWIRYQRKQRLARDLRLRLLQVRLSSHDVSEQEGEGKQRDPLEEIAKSMQLFGVLARADASIVFEVAVHNVGEEIVFYIGVPMETLEFTIRQIQGIWPDAQVDPVADDYTIFNPQGSVKMVTLKLKEHYALPIRTYREATVDTFGPILGNFAKLNAVGEGLALQLIVRRAHSGLRKEIIQFVYELKKGKKLSKLFHTSLKDMLFPRSKSGDKDKPEPTIVDEEAVKALESKVAQPLLAVNVRLVASAPTPYRAGELLDGLAGSFSAFTAPLRNDVKVVQLGESRSALMQFIFREYDRGQELILNAEEAGSLFHFPISTTDIPRVKSTKAREAQPPINLPKAGTLIGESVYRGEVRPVFIGEEDRRRHVYVIGQTGTGKSNTLTNMMTADIMAGKGAALIDPHGELVDSVLANIPKSRYRDVIIFDPSDRMYPLGLNMLEYDHERPEQKTFIVNEMQSIFNKLFDQATMGPMFEQYMRNALLLLMEDTENPATLMEVPRVFTDAEFRERKLAVAKNPVVIDFWTKEATKVGGEASLANMTPYITSKFGNFIANDYMRPIIGQQQSAFNFRKCMDEGKILLVNLSKGRIGDINANLLGMVTIGKLLMAALSRVDMPQEQRKDFNLYIDEFQNFATDSIATILSEARKYRLNLVIAHQFIAQLEENIRDAVFGNVGSMLIYRVGADDAEFLEKQFLPTFSKSDLMNIDNFNAYAKLLIGGQVAKPFNIRMIKAPSGDVAVRDNLKELSRRVYGKERYVVEEEILKRLRE